MRENVLIIWHQLCSLSAFDLTSIVIPWMFQPIFQPSTMLTLSQKLLWYKVLGFSMAAPCHLRQSRIFSQIIMYQFSKSAFHLQLSFQSVSFSRNQNFGCNSSIEKRGHSGFWEVWRIGPVSLEHSSWPEEQGESPQVLTTSFPLSDSVRRSMTHSHQIAEMI